MPPLRPATRRRTSPRRLVPSRRIFQPHIAAIRLGPDDARTNTCRRRVQPSVGVARRGNFGGLLFVRLGILFRPPDSTHFGDGSHDVWPQVRSSFSVRTDYSVCSHVHQFTSSSSDLYGGLHLAGTIWPICVHT